MGTFDISRINFDKTKHYSSVRMQQGRILIDDDWNENNRIQEEEDRLSKLEIIGAFGSPDRGFQIQPIPEIEGLNDAGKINFLIKAGTLYLGGLRFELEEDETYRLQKDWLQQAADLDKAPPAGAERFDLVYIETWQQAVSAVEDESLFEVALGGPDTTTRLRTMRRVHIAADIGFGDCARAWKQLTTNWETQNLGIIDTAFERKTDANLKVGFDDTGLSDDLCSPAAAGGYLGAENQAIRIQIIDSSHFTWGFDNASPLYRVTVGEDGKTVHMLTEPKDQYHWPLSNQVVEILPWSAVLSNGKKVAEQRGHLSKVDDSFEPVSRAFTIKDGLPAVPSPFGSDWESRSDSKDLNNEDPAEYFYMRVWNRGNDLNSDPEISYIPGTPVKLGNTGLEVTITGNDLGVSDYWVIAARPETPNRVVPWELEQGMAPHGVRRFFAPLAVIRWSTEDNEVLGEIIHDCRKTFRPLTELDSCCTYHVGDGLQSNGDFNSIEKAITHLPEAGGKICVLPGTHIANVQLLNLKDVRISGCGERSIVLPSFKRLEDPIFFISGAQNIQIDNLSMLTLRGTAIVLRDTDDTPRSSQEIMINDNHILACINGIHVSVDADRGEDNKITILRNKIGMFDKEDGDVAIFSLADGVLIERNEIFVENPPNPDDPNDPRDPEDPNDPSNPCAKSEPFYTVFFPLALFLFNFFLHAQRLFLLVPFVHQYKTKGGIQIGGSSERVRILENKIAGGYGNGITLGHLPHMDSKAFQDDVVAKYATYNKVAFIDSFEREEIAAFVKESFLSTLYEISIENNVISRMGLSGIGIQTFFNINKIELFISLEDLTIYRNTIKNCARQIPVDIPEQLQNEIGFGGISLGDVNEAIIQENRLEDNGLNHADPICGLFIFNGEKIDIANNHILNNGPFDPKITKPIRDGRRGGIVVANSFKQFKELADSSGNIQPILFDNSFAIKVHYNVVIQPLGHALFLMAYGPVSVVGNQMSSQGVNTKNTDNVLAGTVFILNLSSSKDLITKDILPRFKEVGNSAHETGRIPKDQLNQLLKALQYLPGGRVLFTNNQITLDLTNVESTIMYSSQLIISLDDVAYNSNQAEITGFKSSNSDNRNIQLITDAFLVGYSVRSNDNRFQEDADLARYSLFSLGHMNSALGNQSTFCLLVFGNLTPPPAIFDGSNIILRPTHCKNDRNPILISTAVTTNDLLTTE